MNIANDIRNIANGIKSTGNDIIALTLTDADKTSRYRFYSRILTLAEISLFPATPTATPALATTTPPAPTFPPTDLTFSKFVWLLWSIKESVYKYVSRSDPRLVFSPLKIRVNGLGIREGYFEGTISYGDVSLFSRSFLKDETIMTVVNETEDFSLIRWGVRVIDDSSYLTQSARVRSFALESLSTILPDAVLRIVKTPDGPPEVWDGQRPLDIPISLAHHGRYIAWSYRLPANSSSYRKSAAN